MRRPKAWRDGSKAPQSGEPATAPGKCSGGGSREVPAAARGSSREAPGGRILGPPPVGEKKTSSVKKKSAPTGDVAASERKPWIGYLVASSTTNTRVHFVIFLTCLSPLRPFRFRPSIVFFQQSPPIVAKLGRVDTCMMQGSDATRLVNPVTNLNRQPRLQLPSPAAACVTLTRRGRVIAPTGRLPRSNNIPPNGHVPPTLGGRAAEVTPPLRPLWVLSPGQCCSLFLCVC